MNKEYIYLEGKAVVIDETGTKRLLSYEENTEEILEQENLIETEGYEINNLKYELEQLTSDISNGKFLRNCCLALPIITTILIVLVMQLGNVASIAPLSPIIGLVNISFFPIAIYDHFKIKHSEKQVISKTAQLDYLGRTLSKDKKKLDELKLTNTPSTMPKEYFFTRKVSNEKENRLVAILELHDFLITNPDALQDFLENGTIPHEYRKVLLKEKDVEIIKSIASKNNLVKKRVKG